MVYINVWKLLKDGWLGCEIIIWLWLWYIWYYGNPYYKFQEASIDKLL